MLSMKLLDIDSGWAHRTFKYGQAGLAVLVGDNHLVTLLSQIVSLPISRKTTRVVTRGSTLAHHNSATGGGA